MSRLLIQGGNRLAGEVTIQGAKNSVLPVLAATILTGGEVELRRCPHLRDVEASIRILQASAFCPDAIHLHIAESHRYLYFFQYLLFRYIQNHSCFRLFTAA